MAVIEDVRMGPFARTIMEDKYSHDACSGGLENWPQICQRVIPTVMHSVKAPEDIIKRLTRYAHERKFMPGGRYLYATGLPYHQTNNCFLFRAEDSREGWGSLVNRSMVSLMTGGGVGVNYSDVRPRGSIIRKTRGTATGPCALMQTVNESARYIRQGGNRRSAVWAGLNWQHSDILEFIRLKDWSPEIRRAKEKDFNAWAPMDGTNISVGLDDDFFLAYADPQHPLHKHAHEVYWTTIERMRKTGEPGFYIDTGDNTGEDLRNACTEITSRDDNDVCNLGSINLSRVQSLREFRDIVECATAFLLAGTVYSLVPFPEIDTIRTKNRRLGLGLMGIHEWLLQRGRQYGPDEELAKYLEVYATNLDYAWKYSEMWGLTPPVKGRSIAPNGTIGIVAETTGGIEPLLCTSYKRYYYDDDGNWRFQYVVDPTAARAIEKGWDVDTIEDAYTLARDSRRRVEMQAWVQQYVDHGISSTINLPAWGTPDNNESHLKGFGDMLMEYLPQLRGITTYPDGARGGQPIVQVDYKTAISQVGEVFYETGNVCELVKGGVCGD